jgi:HAD superfamily hydrolase (TIGR01509 family)
MGGDKLVAAVAGDDVERKHGDGIRAAEKALYLALIQEVSVMDGARELIVELKRRGHPVVLASSGKEREVDHYLDLLDARDLVEGWTTSADVEDTKPEPDLVAAAMDKVDADQGVMVGDSPFDSESAKRLGMETIAVLTGGFSEEELSAGAVAVFASLIDLREGLDGTPLA